MKGCDHMIFTGCGVAIVTPFHKDGTINFSKLEELIEYQIANQTDAIIICGTTGESATMSTEEKKQAIEFTIHTVNHRIPVIAGTGGNNTETAMMMSEYAEVVGADGVLVVTPYYNKCTQKGLYEHYKKIAKSISIPIILYNVPSRTGVNIEIATLQKLATIKNIVAIKEASGNISQTAEMIAKLPSDFWVYSGNDDQTLPILSLGGKGVISVVANIYPQEMHDLCTYYLSGDITKSKEIFYELFDIMKALFIEVNPIPIKEAMNILGFQVGPTRLPLCAMESKHKKILKKCLEK